MGRFGNVWGGNTKTPGPDNMPAVMWKSPIFYEQLLDFCNETYKGNKPAAFWMSSITPLPKKGDLQLPQNYRGITLSPLASKIYNSMLLNRISPHIDPILRQNQNGFRKGRLTLPQILALRRIIEELRISKRKASIVFVDFSKAFDSVNRKIMLHNYPVELCCHRWDCQGHCHHVWQSIKLCCSKHGRSN